MWNGTCSVQLNSIPRYTNLRKLYFKGDLNIESGVDDDFIRNLNLKQLIELSLEFCHEITDIGLDYIAHGCQQVENLKISMCNKITDHGIEQLAIGCKKLKIIYLRDVHVTDESLKHVLNEFEKVEKLTLDGYSNISDTVIPHAMTSCKNLQQLKLPNCANVTTTSYERFEPHYTYLKGGGRNCYC